MTNYQLAKKTRQLYNLAALLRHDEIKVVDGEMKALSALCEIERCRRFQCTLAAMAADFDTKSLSKQVSDRIKELDNFLEKER